jgi:hypothetical protein
MVTFRRVGEDGKIESLHFPVAAFIAKTHKKWQPNSAINEQGRQLTDVRQGLRGVAQHRDQRVAASSAAMIAPRAMSLCCPKP